MKRGMDVSTYQGDINWAKVKADGIDFAIIKATHVRSLSNASLRNFADSKFAQNIVDAIRCGMRIGVYHFLTAMPVTEAMQVADYFLSVFEPYRHFFDLWAVVDVEDDRMPRDKTLMTQIVNAFCSLVQSAGYMPMVYTNPDWLKNRLNDVSYWDLWLALWRNKSNVPTVKQYQSLRVWQWGGEVVDGINGKVDSNFMIRDIETVKTDEKPVSQTEHLAGKDNTPSEWAEDSVEWCVDNKILLGDEKGDLMLHRPLTREQSCLVAQRLYQKSVEDAAAEVAKRMLAALKLKIE